LDALIVAALASSRSDRTVASSVRRDASFTASPITVYSYRCLAPMFPATTSPVDTPMAASTSG
jgi:hypothetical protein